jgi:hypothetical protein
MQNRRPIAMPYTITTHQRIYKAGLPTGFVRSHRQTADTPEEAREAVIEATGGAYSIAEHNSTLDAIAALPESGGIIGPLPDGLMIDVQPIPGDTGMLHGPNRKCHIRDCPDPTMHVQGRYCAPHTFTRLPQEP